MLLNGQPFNNSAGCVTGAVDFNSTSPNFPGLAHNLFELRVALTGGPGGCYSPEPAFWSATLPGVRPIVPMPAPFGIAALPVVESFTASETFVSVSSNGTTSVVPTVEGPQGDPTCSDGLDNDGDGATDRNDTACAVPLVGFVCHKAIASPRFASMSDVSVVDQFRSTSVIAKKAKTLCAPETVSQPDHLIDYQVKAPKFDPVRNVTVTDEFGTLLFDVLKPDSLLVPGAKSLSGPPSPLATEIVDHFSCYKVKRAKGATTFPPRLGVSVSDQFGNFTVDVKKPKRLCAPANKNDESPGAETHAEHLLCYQAKGPKMTTVSPVHTADQFGSLTSSVSDVAEVCVPAIKTLAP